MKKFESFINEQNKSEEIDIAYICKSLEDKTLSSEEIKSIISKKDKFLDYCSEYVLYKLYTNNIISKDEFISQFSDLDVFDDEICMYIDDFKELSEFMNKNEKENIIKFLYEGGSEIFDWYHQDFDTKDFEYCWDHITKENKEYIIKSFLNKPGTIYEFEWNNQKCTLKDYYFDHREFYIDVDDKSVKIIEIFLVNPTGTFDDAWDAMRGAYSDAYRDSIEAQTQTNINKCIVDLFGNYMQVKRGRFTSGDGKKYDKFVYIFNEIDLSIFNSGVISRYDKDDEEFYTNAYYGSYKGFFKGECFDVDSGYNKISFNQPEDGFSGDIRKYIDEQIEQHF